MKIKYVTTCGMVKGSSLKFVTPNVCIVIKTASSFLKKPNTNDEPNSLGNPKTFEMNGANVAFMKDVK